MSQHLPINCPKCGSDLSVRVQNLGRKGICKHCGHVFRAQLDNLDELLPILAGPPGPSPDEGDAEHAQHRQGWGLKQIRALFSSQSSGISTHPLQRENIDGGIAQLGGAGQDHEESAALIGVMEQAKGSTEISRDDHQESREALARTKEVENLRNERNRLWGEAQDVRARMDALAAEANQQLGRLTKERNAARAKAERLSAERSGLALELKQTREQFAAERDSLAQELDRLRKEFEALDRLKAEAASKHDETRRLWEEERRDLEERSEQQHGTVVDQLKREAAEQRDLHVAEQQVWCKERDEHARVADERGRFAREVGRLRDRLDEVERARVKAETELSGVYARRDEDRREFAAACDQQNRERLAEVELTAGRRLITERNRWSAERDELAREVERLRSEAETELKAAREQWASERSELEAQWALQRQELLDDTERRLQEQQAQFGAELQAWRAQLDERERGDIERDSLARKSEEAHARLGAERDALVLEVGQIRDRLAELERSKVSADAEFDKARARWKIEQQEMEARWDQERQALIAKQQAGREHLKHHDLLIDERDTLKRDVGQLRNRLDEVEHGAAASEAELVAASAHWDLERRELEGEWERRCQDILTRTEQRIAEQRNEFDAERRSWRRQAEVDRESLRKEIDALQSLLDAVRRERDGAIKTVSAKSLDGDRLKTQLAEVEASLRQSERDRRAERDKLMATLEESRRESQSVARLSAERAEEIRVQRVALEQRQQALAQEYQRKLNANRHEWEVERQRWIELLDAAHPQTVGKSPAIRDAASELAERVEGTGLPLSLAAEPAARSRRSRPLGAAVLQTPRPQAISYDDPQVFRSDLEKWLTEAQGDLQEMSANPGRSANETRTKWLEYEIRTAQAEIDLLPREPSPESPEPQEESILPTEEA